MQVRNRLKGAKLASAEPPMVPLHTCSKINQAPRRGSCRLFLPMLSRRRAKGAVDNDYNLSICSRA